MATMPLRERDEWNAADVPDLKTTVKDTKGRVIYLSRVGKAYVLSPAGKKVSPAGELPPLNVNHAAAKVENALRVLLREAKYAPQPRPRTLKRKLPANLTRLLNTMPGGSWTPKRYHRDT